MILPQKKWVAVSAALLLGACQATSPGPAAWEEEVLIHRDAFGMPHIEALTDAGAIYGWMYARAEDEFEKIEQACFLTLGRNAEFLGEDGLPWDRLVHALEVPRRAQETYAAMEPEIRQLCDAGAASMNAFLQRNPDRGVGLLERFEPWHFVAQSYSWHLYKAASVLQQELGHVVGLEAFSFPDGSNAWAIAPQRTAQGKALLLINPHLALGEIFEGHCHSQEGLHVTGGSPFGRNLMPLYGHNDDLAWALTVNNPDVVDLYSLVCHSDDNGLRHLWEGEWRSLESRRTRVRGEA